MSKSVIKHKCNTRRGSRNRCASNAWPRAELLVGRRAASFISRYNPRPIAAEPRPHPSWRNNSYEPRLRPAGLQAILLIKALLMNLQNDPQSLALMKFGIGQPVLRTEDPMLVRGEGRYTDDISSPGEAYAVMVRSRVAHGVIKRDRYRRPRARCRACSASIPAPISPATARSNASCRSRTATARAMKQAAARRRWPTDKVRFVGDPVAFVVAETPLQAKDAAEAVEVDIDPLPAVDARSEAVQPGAPLIHDDAPGNVALDYHYGDGEQVAAAFAKAAHVTRLKLVNSRVVVNAMEPRAAIGVYEPASGRFTLHAPSQGVFGMQGNMADILGSSPKQVRILTGNVGGSFGMKAAPFPEYVCVLHAARELGRPVKWTDERSGSFVSDSHGRDHELTAELALDEDGKFLARAPHQLRQYGRVPVARWRRCLSTLNTVKNVQSVYRTPLIEVSTKCVFTNTTQVSAYRGAGRPEGNYYMERLIDAAAAEMGIDRLELRRRNQIKPREIPLKTAVRHDLRQRRLSGRARARARGRRRQGLRAQRKRESRKRGKLRGLGIGSFLEVTAPPSKEMGGIRFEADGDGHHHHRHARLRPGPRRAVRAGAEREARHSVRAHPPAAGRQRRAARRRRHRRLEIDHAQRHRDRRSRRPR